MKQLLYLILLAGFIIPVQAGDTYGSANEAYEKGQYDEAVSLYQQFLNEEGEAAIVHYNLGNAYFKLSQYGNAILHYEKALLLDRRMEDARCNLALANSRIRDKIEPIQQPILYLFWYNVTRLLYPHQWALLSLICGWLALSGGILFVLKRHTHLRKTAVYTMLYAGILTLFFAVIAWSAEAMEQQQEAGIIMEPTVILKSEPSENSTNLFILHEGLKLRILETDNDWLYVSMPDGNLGWVRKATVARI